MCQCWSFHFISHEVIWAKPCQCNTNDWRRTHVLLNYYGTSCRGTKARIGMAKFGPSISTLTVARTVLGSDPPCYFILFLAFWKPTCMA